MTKSIRLFVILCCLVFSSELFAAGGHHFLVLMKPSQSYSQTYASGRDWPTEWVKEYWDKGYDITWVNDAGQKWFIVMTKFPNSQRQRILRNPSSKELNDNLRDGWIIKTATSNWDRYDGSQGRLYVLNKISTESTQADIKFQFGGTSDMSSFVESAWERDLDVIFVKNLRERRFSDRSALAVATSEIIGQTYVYREAFPRDFISNKKSEGYRLQSLAHFERDNKWFVLMSKARAPRPWAYYNFSTNRKKIDELRAKGFMIVGVF